MVLYLIGLGLGDEKDITIRGLEAVKSCDTIFLEHYTSILGPSTDFHQRLEKFYQKSIILADRHLVESDAEQIYEPALHQNVAMLVVGDPVCATTHTDIMIRAQNYGCHVEIIHNASVMGAVGSCGLQLYNFGQTVSIPFFDDEWRPTSFYPKIKYNRLGGMHTLCLLDIKVKEPDFIAMTKGQTKFLPPRYMTVNQCCHQLIEAEQKHGEKVYDPNKTLCVGLARLGQQQSNCNQQHHQQQIVAGTLQELAEVDFGLPLHSFIMCGNDIHELELEVLKEYMVPNSTYQWKEEVAADNKKPSSKQEEYSEEVL